MQKSNEYQHRYWHEMVQLKSTIYYLEEYLQESEKKEKYLNVYLAITSNGSICGWVIWDSISFVWAIIIAGSQLINAIRSYFPFNRRVKMISKMLPELDNLFSFTERKWFPIAEGNLSLEDIHDLNIKIKKQETEIIRKYTMACNLPKRKSYLSIAMDNAKTYFYNNYHLGAER